MKNLIKTGFVGLLVLLLVPHISAQEKKVAPPVSKPKSLAQINKFEDEMQKATLAHIQKVKKDRINQVNSSTEDRIKAAKEKTAVQKKIVRGAGPDANQKFFLQLQEIDNNLAKKEKVSSDEFQEKQKQQQDEFVQKMKKRREEFYK